MTNTLLKLLIVIVTWNSDAEFDMEDGVSDPFELDNVVSLSVVDLDGNEISSNFYAITNKNIEKIDFVIENYFALIIGNGSISDVRECDCGRLDKLARIRTECSREKIMLQSPTNNMVYAIKLIEELLLYLHTDTLRKQRLLGKRKLEIC